MLAQLNLDYQLRYFTINLTGINNQSVQNFYPKKGFHTKILLAIHITLLQSADTKKLTASKDHGKPVMRSREKAGCLEVNCFLCHSASQGSTTGMIWRQNLARRQTETEFRCQLFRQSTEKAVQTFLLLELAPLSSRHRPPALREGPSFHISTDSSLAAAVLQPPVSQPAGFFRTNLPRVQTHRGHFHHSGEAHPRRQPSTCCHF